jgi:hypothetical protein
VIIKSIEMKIKYQLVIIFLLIANVGYSQKKVKLCSSESSYYLKSSTSLSCNTSQTTFSATGNCDNLCEFLCESFSIPVVITLINNSNNDLNVTISHANSTFSQAKVPFLQGKIDLQLTTDFGQNPRIISDNTLYNSITNANSSAEVMDELRLSPYYQSGYLNIFITEHNNSPSAYIGSNDAGYQIVQVPASQINITSSDFHIETFIHEIGHNLGLLHTFDGYFNGNGQPQCTQDGIGDTDFDPYDGVNQTIVGGNITNCQWQNSTNVIYDPPIDNYMSYYYGDLSTNCQFNFTDCQISKMQNIVEQCKVPIWGGLETVDLSNGLVAYYPFNGNANDESGNGHHGTVNGATLITDRFDNINSSFYFDGEQDWIEINNLNLNSDEITISFWATIDYNFQDNYSRYFFDSSPSSNRYLSYKSLNNAYVVHAESNPIVIINSQPSWWESNNWLHFILYYNQATGNFTQHINNNKEIDISDNWNQSNIIDFFIGRRFENANFLENHLGKIDDFRIYDRALNCSERESLYLEGCTSINIVQNQTINLDTVIHALDLIELYNVTVNSPYELILKAPEILIENNCQVNQGAKLEVINEESCFEN